MAQTITALSQRLVKLEQRQEALELQLRVNEQDSKGTPEEIEMLDGVQQLLKECQELLETSNGSESLNQSWDDQEDNLAA